MNTQEILDDIFKRYAIDSKLGFKILLYSEKDRIIQEILIPHEGENELITKGRVDKMLISYPDGSSEWHTFPAPPKEGE